MIVKDIKPAKYCNRPAHLLSLVTALSACLVSTPVPGQIEVGVSVAPSRAVLYEPVEAAVVIRNNTGAVLTFGSGRDSARFFFELERVKNELIPLRDRSLLLGGKQIVPAGSETNVFSLTGLFDLQSRGVYKLRACVEWQATCFASAPVEFEILKGFEIARVIAGVPAEPGAMRVYTLEYITKDSGEYAYLRIEDEQAKVVYGAHQLGQIVRVRKPELKIDEVGNVHVLFHGISMGFTHAAFTPYGVHLFSRHYPARKGAVALRSLPNGQVAIDPAAGQEGVIEQTQAESSPTAGADEEIKKAVRKKMGRGGLFGPRPD